MGQLVFTLFQKLADEPIAEPFLLQGGINVLVSNCACMRAKELKRHNVF